VAGGLLLGIRLRFHHHAPQQLPSGLAFHQQAADELGCNLLGGSGEEGLRECWEVPGGYGSGLGKEMVGGLNLHKDYKGSHRHWHRISATLLYALRTRKQEV